MRPTLESAEALGNGIELKGAQKATRSFASYRAGTVIALLAGYASYYLCRQNLSVAYAPMRDELGITMIQFGWITSVGTLIYSLGKVSTGSYADSKRGGRSIFFLGLFGSAICSLIFGASSGLYLFMALWGINRLFQSMGWGGLVNVMARWFPAEIYGTAMGLMAVSYQFGGVVASLYMGLILSLGGGWRALFFIPGLTLILMGAICWRFLINSPRDVGYELPVSAVPVEQKPEQPAADEELTYFQRFRVLLCDGAFLTMAGLSFILTFLRECFNVWMPAYFSEMGASASTAAFKSSVFPLLGCIGTLFSGWFSDRFLGGRRGPVMAALMVGLVFSLLGLSHVDEFAQTIQAAGVSWLSRSNLAMILVGAVGFFLLGPYSMVAGVVALDFGGRKTAGTAAGLLDGAGYLAASLSGVGVAELLVRSGWTRTYDVMAVITLVGIALCLILWKVKPRTDRH